MKTRTNSPKQLIAISILTLGMFAMTSCGKQEAPPSMSKDYVNQSVLKQVRLGDGVPLDIEVAVRWRIEDYATFSAQFASPERYDSLILLPRELELANDISNQYDNVDTLFNSQRHTFITDLKTYLMNNLGEEGIQIKEVIVSDIHFPAIFTGNKEKLALQDQELERIRKQTVIDMEKAEADRLSAEGQGKVAMAQAEMDAKVQRIKSETEKSIRLNRLAKAETQKQVAKLEAESEAQRRKLLAKADLEQKEDLKDLDMKKQRELDKIAFEKEERLTQLQFDQELKMAQLCSENPGYATYMVNKELASKVQIAVLPNNQDGSVLNSLLSNTSAR